MHQKRTFKFDQLGLTFVQTEILYLFILGFYIGLSWGFIFVYTISVLYLFELEFYFYHLGFYICLNWGFISISWGFIFV